LVARGLDGSRLSGGMSARGALEAFAARLLPAPSTHPIALGSPRGDKLGRNAAVCTPAVGRRVSS